MTGVWILDLALCLMLLGYVVYGYRIGLLRSVAAIIGIVAAAIVAFLLIPMVAAWIPQPNWRVGAVLSLAFVLLIGGNAAGVALGGLLHRAVRAGKLRVVDRVLGAAVSLVVASLVTSMVASSIASLGIPFLSPAIASSAVLRTIDSLTPDPAKALLAQLRSLVTQQGLPRVAEALGLPSSPQTLPSFDTHTAALDRAARSVVKVTGNAYACGQSQSGSGFVVAHDRVITNAHVVAGVSQPVIEVPGHGAVSGRVVYFDPQGDLAVIAAPGISAPALPLVGTLTMGTAAVADGYPFGGPFSAQAARVVSVETVQVANIYGAHPSDREIYQLAADVEQGNSGGPLLTRAGQVAGVVFAKGTTGHNVGYAITMSAVSAVAAKSEALSKRVSSGSCVKE